MRKIILAALIALLIPIASAEVVEHVVKPVPMPVQMQKIDYRNLTKLIIQPEYKYLRIKAGETKTFVVKIKNPTNKDVKITPKVVSYGYETNVIDESWISFSKKEFTLNAKAEGSVTITVSVPSDADKGYYHGYIAFTNDSVTIYGMEKYINSLSLSVEVWIPPSVKIYPRWISDKVEAGKSYEYEVNVVNTGDKSFTINPKLSEEETYFDEYGYVSQITKDMVHISAPSTIPPKSSVKVKIKIDVPPNAKGMLRGAIDLGINDPGLDKWQQRVEMNLRIYEIPKEPFIKEISIDNASKLVVKVTTNSYKPVYYPILYGIKSAESNMRCDVNVSILSPSGKISIKPKITENLFVTLGMGPPWEEVSGIYKVTSVSKTIAYTIENPENGIWKIKVMPKGCEQFNLQIEVE